MDDSDWSRLADIIDECSESVYDDEGCCVMRKRIEVDKLIGLLRAEAETATP